MAGDNIIWTIVGILLICVLVLILTDKITF